MTLDQLIEAIAGAVVEAEDIVRRRQIAAILSYFDAEGTPATLDFRLTPAVAAADGSIAPPNRVPLMTLVPMNGLAVRDMTIEFSTELGSVETPPAPKRGYVLDDESNIAVAQMAASRLPFKMALLNVTQPAAVRESSPSAAKVTLRVKATDPPEGLARIIQRLNQTI